MPVPLDEDGVVLQRFLPLEHGQTAPALQMPRHRLAEQVEQRWHQVDLADGAANIGLSRGEPGHTHQKRHPRGLVVESPFLQHPVVPKQVAVLAGEHHHRVIGDAGPVQGRGDLADHPVHQGDVGEIVSAEPPPTLLGGYVLLVGGVLLHVVIVVLVPVAVHVLLVIVGPGTVQ